MKKKIVFGLAIFALMFFFGSVYVMTTTQSTIYELHRLSQMHRTVALRKDLLLSIKKNQENIILQSRHFAMAEALGEQGMTAIVERCFVCHANSPVEEKIVSLKKQIDNYHVLTQAALTADSGTALSGNRVDDALAMGDNLMKKMEGIITLTSSNLERQERAILRKINERKTLLFIMVTIGPLFAVGLAFFLIRGLTRPVNSLLEATRRLQSGDLDHRISGFQDEFGEVADSFNEMAASLKKQIAEMQRMEQLRVCGEMAAGLVHEIRNPLAGMKLSIEILLSELELEERFKEVLLKVIEQIRNIELLMKNLLNYARPIAAQPVRFNVNRTLEQTIYFIEKHPSFISSDPNRHLIRELDKTVPEIFGDPQQLQQVFLNLLLNAADAISEGGSITVRTIHDRQAETVAIAVQDTGKGISLELQEKIFHPFFTTKSKGKGTGLGLAVSKRIVEEHGGRIEVMNNRTGGVTFTVTLPVKADQEGTSA